MIRTGGRGQWFVLAMFTRAKMRQSEQYEYLCVTFFKKHYHSLINLNNFSHKNIVLVHLEIHKENPDFKCKTSRMQNSPIPNLIRLYNNS